MIAKLKERLVAAMRRNGLDLRPMRLASGKLGGASLQWDRDEPWRRRGILVESPHYPVPVRFFVSRPQDLIQREHATGRFYEEEELAIIAAHYRGGTFVDVGCNIGNHSIYMLKLAGAERVVAFEPNPTVLALLRINLAVNDLASRVTIHEVGLADSAGTASIDVPETNLGAGRLSREGEAGQGGTLQLARGDDLLGDTDAGFIKMDVEGFELAALAGLKQTILRCQPVLFVEVEDQNLPPFRDFLASVGYRLAETFCRYPGLTNCLAVPAG